MSNRNLHFFINIKKIFAYVKVPTLRYVSNRIVISLLNLKVRKELEINITVALTIELQQFGIKSGQVRIGLDDEKFF